MDIGATIIDGLTNAGNGFLSGGPLGAITGLLSGMVSNVMLTPHLQGPQGQAVAAAVRQAVVAATGTPDPTPAAVAGLSPDARAALETRLAEIAVSAAASERSADLERFQATLADTKDARAQMLALASIHSVMAYGGVVVSVVIVAAFGWATYNAVGGHMTGTATGTGDILVGTLAAMATQVANFWLGSSAGSQKKDGLLANSMPVPVGRK